MLLPETGPDDALSLATLMKRHDRAAAVDRRRRRAPGQVSVAVASARPLNGYPIDADRIVDELDAAIESVKDGERSRIEVSAIHPVIAADPVAPADE